MDYEKFENKVKSMTSHDIIMAMVDGLRQPRTEINMNTFGNMIEGICYGCAATNAVLRIMDANKHEVVNHILGRAPNAYRSSAMKKFEFAIDWLRRGRVDLYNYYAAECGIAPITPIPGQELPILRDDYTEEELQEYVKLAEYQKGLEKSFLKNFWCFKSFCVSLF